MKWIVRIGLGVLGLILILAVLLAGYGLFAVRNSFPKTSGEVQITGLDAPVEIYRDQLGIPHIYASTQHDLFFAQGYVHAQDRFWQMDFWRHIGSGRLAEMFGQDQVETDRFLRTLGWARVAQQELESLDPVTRAILDDYAQGVNAYLADHQGSALSFEYTILKLLNPDYQPEPWQPLHSLTWAKAMAWDLRGNMGEETARANLLKSLTPEQIDQLYPPYPADKPVILPDFQLASAETAGNALARTPTAGAQSGQSQALSASFAALNERLALLDPLLGTTGAGIGSNNWVISGKLTSTGKPLLVNDPHLGIQMPSIWYEIGLHCTPKSAQCNFDVTGFSFASAPGVVIGHNDRIAWGFTNVGPDVTDLVIEKVNPDNPNQYEYNGEWLDMTLVEETIQVAGGDAAPVTVRITRHGPIIWDSAEERQETQEKWGVELPEHFAIALRWTALEPSNTFPAIWKMNIAQNWDEFRAAAREFDVPSQNFIYADIDGNIGYQTPGKIPLRRSGDGRYPVPGWTDLYEWTGYIPFEELPFAFNPSAGFIATANNAVVGPNYPYLITADWDYGFRAQRIVDLIQNAGGPIDIAYIQKMQGDGKDLNAEILTPELLALPLEDARLANARALLEGWDYQNTMDSAPAALFNAFWRHLLAVTFQDEIQNEAFWPAGGSRYFTVVQNLLAEPGAAWWDNLTTAEVETKETIFLQALTQAVDELEKMQGKDPARWRWGDLHTATFRNATLGESGIGPIEALFNRGPFPTSGGDSIVNATGWNTLEPYEVDWLPSMRMIVDLSDLSNSLSIHTTGQSGHAYHPHYIDMADLWRTIQYHPMLWERAQVEANQEGLLKLTP
jgi:penicillin amidase